MKSGDVIYHQCEGVSWTRYGEGCLLFADSSPSGRAQFQWTIELCGFPPYTMHNELRSLTTKVISAVCSDVCAELHMEPLEGEAIYTLPPTTQRIKRVSRHPDTRVNSGATRSKSLL